MAGEQVLLWTHQIDVHRGKLSAGLVVHIARLRPQIGALELLHPQHLRHTTLRPPRSLACALQDSSSTHHRRSRSSISVSPSAQVR